MFRRSLFSLFGLLLFCGATFAQGTPTLKETKGKLVEIDLEDKSVDVKTADGKTVEFTIATTSKVMDDKGKPLADGFKSKLLTADSQVKVVTLEKGKIIKELHLLVSAPAKAATGSSSKSPATSSKSASGTFKTESSTKITTKESTSSKTGSKDTASKSPSSKNSTAAKSDDKEEKWEPKGAEAKVLKVDTEKRVLQVEMVEGKKTATFTLGDKVEFYGPRGGETDIDDDRLAAGAIIKLEMDSTGKNITKVHLPYRKRKDADK